MPVSLAFNADHRILCVTLEGQADPLTFQAALRAITSATEFPPDVDVVWDFTRADFAGVHSDQLRQMLAIRFQHADRGNGLVAIAAAQDVAFGLSRLFQGIASDRLQARMTVVRSVKAAQDWILENRRSPQQNSL